MSRFSSESIVTTNKLSIFLATLLLSTKILLQIEQVSKDPLPLLQKTVTKNLERCKLVRNFLYL